MTTYSYPIGDSLHLIECVPETSTEPAKAVEVQTNHICIIDCSGSMSSDLPKVRKQLKDKLPRLLNPNDTMTLIWFSGKGQCGCLMEAEPVPTLLELQAVHKAIDRWLAPIGLTGFKEPLELAENVARRVLGRNPNGVCSLFFMSDGCDNEWSRGEVLAAVKAVSQVCVSATFVEYGYYADRALLAAMAEEAGGTHIFTESFPEYEPAFSLSLQKRHAYSRRLEVDLKVQPIGGFAFALHDGDLLTYQVIEGKALVHEYVEDLFAISSERHPNENLSRECMKMLDALYAALSLYAVRMDSDTVYKILRFLGDARFTKLFSGCFGKQKYSAFVEAAKRAALSTADRFREGVNHSLVPDDDAFTLLELLRLLISDDSTRVLLDDPTFQYNRIGRKQIDANDGLLVGEQDLAKDLATQLALAKTPADVKVIQAQIDELMVTKKAALKFEAKPVALGYEIQTLTYNEERPNISLLVRKEGHVDLSGRMKEHVGDAIYGALAVLPPIFPTYIYRNYAIVKDGLVNIETLPLLVSPQVIERLDKAGVPWRYINDAVVPEDAVASGLDSAILIGLKGLPIINRTMVRTASAKKLLTLEWELTCARAKQKVYNTYRKTLFPKESKGYKLVYGEVAAAWLQEQGLTDYNGFNPRRVSVESTDFYMSKELNVKLKGYATLPSVKDVKDRMGKKALTGCAALMGETIAEVDAWLEKNKKPSLQEMYLEGCQKMQTAVVRGLLEEKACQIFSIIVGQTWFHEWSSLAQNSMEIETPQGKVLGTIEMAEKPIRI